MRCCCSDDDMLLLQEDDGLLQETTLLLLFLFGRAAARQLRATVQDDIVREDKYYKIRTRFQLEVFILDCAISQVLNARKAPKELLPWFTYCPETMRLAVFPYCSRRHWSLAIIDIQEKYTMYFNSLPETIHSEIKKCQCKITRSLTC
ncbi:hypothetical protein GOP47_0015372 [Adiantum capillus-veneris]|uniref:Ubiquitin-like protease family profile domain-containing protein n=1 Tax=Adiantum capillus-veneris TaxID=13818 RepID=A0A9D4ZDX9_ADICA|nr:hypothetical protein GOP47_0015372 [Adiantum capillus-veneris]